MFLTLYFTRFSLNFPHQYTGWEGRYCENDLDGCSELTCFEGVQCYDVQAPESGAICGSCPDGYVGDGEKCAGI